MTKYNEQEVTLKPNRKSSDKGNKTPTSRDFQRDIKRINENASIELETNSNYVLGYN
jgi:hypothetical protein